MPQNEEQITLGDLLSAHGELQSIQTLLTDRSEVGTYAKVDALCEEREALLAALKEARLGLQIAMLLTKAIQEDGDYLVAKDCYERAQAAIRKATDHG